MAPIIGGGSACRGEQSSVNHNEASSGSTALYCSLTVASPHVVLGIAPDATDENVRLAYRRLCRQHHPDKTGGGDGARFAAIHEAYGKIRSGSDAVHGFRVPATASAGGSTPSRPTRSSATTTLQECLGFETNALPIASAIRADDYQRLHGLIKDLPQPCRVCLGIGNTPMHFCAFFDSAACADLLLNFGEPSDLLMRNNEGDTPFAIAFSRTKRVGSDGAVSAIFARAMPVPEPDSARPPTPSTASAAARPRMEILPRRPASQGRASSGSSRLRRSHPVTGGRRELDTRPQTADPVMGANGSTSDPLRPGIQQRSGEPAWTAQAQGAQARSSARTTTTDWRSHVFQDGQPIIDMPPSLAKKFGSQFVAQCGTQCAGESRKTTNVLRCDLRRFSGSRTGSRGSEMRPRDCLRTIEAWSSGRTEIAPESAAFKMREVTAQRFQSGQRSRSAARCVG